MASLINIGVTGLTAAQTALSTTGNNITNANTAGYSRERVNLVTLKEQYSGGGYLGSGVNVDSITRVVEQFTIDQLRTNTASFNGADSQYSQYSQLDSLLADQSTGISSVMQGVFDAIQQASQDPTSVATRQVVLSSAGNLSQRLNTLYAQLQSQSSVINDQLTSLTGQVTNLAAGIAKLNQNIAAAPGGTKNPPNDMLDQRDELIKQLSELVDVKAVQQSDGMMNVFIGNGQSLVVGTQAATLSTAPSVSDPTKLEVVFGVSGSASGQQIGNLLTGGKLGGLLQYRNNGLSSALNTLGRIALTFADTMNQQQKLGLDLNGNFGNNIFTDINSTAAQQARVVPASTNTSASNQLAVSITNTANLTASDYQLNFSSATAYTLTRISDGVAVGAGAIGALPATIATPDGFQINIASGALAAGDRFLIQPTRQASRDIAVALQKPEELAFAQPIRTDAALTNSGGGAISAGNVLATRLASGALQSTFATANTLSPPLLVRFTSATAYTILNNTNPAAPVALVPPITGTITPGQDNVVTINDPVSGNAVYQFTLSGNPATNDQFTIGFNQTGSSDNRNAVALGNLKLAKTVGGNLTFSDSYGQLVSGVGSRTAELKINRDAADTLLTQAQANRDSVSGVNLDEEAANLVKFEQAYNASAQVISISRSLFDTLLGAFR